MLFHAWALPAPAYIAPDKATGLEGAIRLYIGGTALHEKALEANPPSSPRGLQTLDRHLFLKEGQREVFIHGITNQQRLLD